MSLLNIFSKFTLASYGFMGLYWYLTRNINIYNDIIGEHIIFTSEDKSSQLERIIKKDGTIVERVYYSSKDKNSYLRKEILIDECNEFEITTRVRYPENIWIYGPKSRGAPLEAYGDHEVRTFTECDIFSQIRLKEETKDVFNRVRHYSIFNE